MCFVVNIFNNIFQIINGRGGLLTRDAMNVKKKMVIHMTQLFLCVSCNLVYSSNLRVLEKKKDFHVAT